MSVMSKTPEERIAEIDKQIEQKKARKRALQSKVNSEERKKRTRLLIEIGGEFIKYCNDDANPITDADLEAIGGYFKQWSGAIKKVVKEVRDGRDKRNGMIATIGTYVNRAAESTDVNKGYQREERRE